MVGVNRIFLMKLHMILAAFILPVAMMFFITGALYTWGEKGSFVTESYELQLKQPMQRNQKWLMRMVKYELAQRDIEPPSGIAKIKKAGNSFYFEWAGSKLVTSLEPTNNPFVAELIIKKALWHRVLVQLHKAKGGKAFKVYAAFLAFCLMVLFVTGFVMAWQLKKYRILLMSTATVGIISFMVMVSIS